MTAAAVAAVKRCIDCAAIGDPGLTPDTRSPRCDFHRRQRRNWIDRDRKRVQRNKGKAKSKHEPVVPYVPKHANEHSQVKEIRTRDATRIVNDLDRILTMANKQLMYSDSRVLDQQLTADIRVALFRLHTDANRLFFNRKPPVIKPRKLVQHNPTSASGGSSARQ
ncbi:hypothetical protein [Knoellia subterranea]|uniref:Uncharacterized protein n=1 Tax=Knoellia subterranea KCTC 19937 TaxID=1385521 RepID=A0A0A0JQ82_9MICO|nr:hypothetical protein [Knoellia subterranea]KGN39600.1 hypothetical protein N803_02000 [Knoellia subterranea KCTC 19937]